MKLNVTGIDILDSKVGVGLKVGDVTFGCARITDMEMEAGKTLEDYALDGMCIGYKVVEKPGEAEKDPKAYTLALDTSTLKVQNANNYVLFMNKGEDTYVIHDTSDIVDLFKLPASDAEEMDKYIGMLANQRELEVVRYTNLETGKESIMFVNKFDREIMEALLDDSADDAFGAFMQMQRNTEYRSQLENHEFIKLMVMSVVQTGQDRYNKLNRDDLLIELAKSFSSIRYWKNGEFCVPSVADIEDYLYTIKENIRIQ